MQIPNQILQQLYTFGSLQNNSTGIRFSLKNRLSAATLAGIDDIRLNGELIPPDQILFDFGDGLVMPSAQMRQAPTIDFPLGKAFEVIVEATALSGGCHTIEMTLQTEPFGQLRLMAQDTVAASSPARPGIPRSLTDDYARDVITARQTFVETFSGVQLDHIKQYSFDPHQTQGNCEHFIGIAQVPLGLAGPLTVKGEYAEGDFLIPLATSEGTLVASYNRGMKALNLSGGVTCTISVDAMQRAPVFVFDTARQARDFVDWVEANMASIRREAEATSQIAILQAIEPYLASKFAYLRFNFSTGDAAGQNMVSRATLAACRWIMDHTLVPIQDFYLESNMATDKKASQLNMLRSRGKRVTAEATLKRELVVNHLRTTPERMHRHANIANVGVMMSGANNKGLHAANAIAAIFMATGQDVANLAESSAGILYTEVTPSGDLYISLTMPSLIVATYGGGTGLPTQRECLALLGCYGQGQVNKLAEIIAGVALAGEISLAAAISAADWVASHEQYGRNR